MSAICQARLTEERKNWRRDHPIGFWAKPRKNSSGTFDMLTWDAGIPGKQSTDWDGGIYPITLYFTNEYPQKPPKVQFPKGFFHPNVYPSGTICLSILNEDQDWRPGIKLKEIMLGIQDLLDTPNLNSPAQQDAYDMLRKDKPGYVNRVKKQARQYAPKD